jgi:hypothetical protein
MDMSIRIRKDCKRSGVRKSTPVGFEEFADLISFVSDRFGLSVNRIDQYDDLSRSFAASQRSERCNCLRDFVV